jgi:acyl-CoA hydrolase
LYDGIEHPPRHAFMIAMPADTNPAGDIFGGWLMSQMDLAAGTLAALAGRGRFQRPGAVAATVTSQRR